MLTWFQGNHYPVLWDTWLLSKSSRFEFVYVLFTPAVSLKFQQTPSGACPLSFKVLSTHLIHSVKGIEKFISDVLPSQGKVKQVTERIGLVNMELLEPTPNFDCHVSRSLQSLPANTAQSQIFEFSQVIICKLLLNRGIVTIALQFLWNATTLVWNPWNPLIGFFLDHHSNRDKGREIL